MSTAVLSKDFLSESVILEGYKKVDATGKKNIQYSIQQAPQSSDGIRRKRKLLTAVQDIKK